MSNRFAPLLAAAISLAFSPALADQKTTHGLQVQSAPGNTASRAVRTYHPSKLKPKWRRQVVRSVYRVKLGSIVVDTDKRFLYLDLGNGKALRYGIAVGRAGFTWRGRSVIAKKAEWPRWTPTARMNGGYSGLSFSFDGGTNNPMGARALYLYSNGKDTLYRLHGGGTPAMIGRAVSAGCIRMLDQDVMDLYRRAGIGTQVFVMAPRAGKQL